MTKLCGRVLRDKAVCDANACERNKCDKVV